MNALTSIAFPRHEPSETAAHHMRMLRRLADLAMALAETAAEEAQSAAIDPEPAYLPEPQADRRGAPTRTERVLAFTRLSRVVTQAISLHAALEAGPKPVHFQAAKDTAESEPDLRRGLLQQAFNEIISSNPQLGLSQSDAYQALEDRLLSSENDYIPLSGLLTLVSADLGLPAEAQPSRSITELFACFEEDDPPDPLD